MSVQAMLETAKQAALEAGAIQLKYYGKLKTHEIGQKTKNDFVTKVDKACEKAIVARILKKYPAHSIQAEEGGFTEGSRTRWIIDPLDGTSNYIHQFPMFAVSIGVMQGPHHLAGVVYDALHDEMFTAVRGRGAFLNGKRFYASPTKKLAAALMSTGIPFRARKRFAQYFRSLKTISLASAGMRRGGSAALDLAYVACGRFDGFWEINLSPWDIAAGALLIQEAGGKVSDVWGGGGYLQSGDILASNGRIHGELRQITSSVFTRK